MFEIFKLDKKKAAIEENIALLEAKQKAMQEKIKALDELEHKRYELQSKIESAVNTGLYRIEQGYTLNDSARRGKEMQDVYGRGLCYAMSGYIDNKEKSATTGNIAKSKELIKNKFNSYQSKANKVGLALNAEYVKARLDMLDINLAIKVKQKEEKA